MTLKYLSLKVIHIVRIMDISTTYDSHLNTFGASQLSYALHKSDNPLKCASLANIIYIHNLYVCFAMRL